MTEGVTVRRALSGDAEAVAAIYNEGIAGRTATFETETRSPEEMARRIRGTDTRHAFLVAVQDGVVIGWAATWPYSPRPVYAGVAEFSVYVARTSRGSGAGRRLLVALLDVATAAGLHKVTSRVFPENVASRSLCAAVGFEEVGLLRRHARLDGRWRDVVVVERLLGSALIDGDAEA